MNLTKELLECEYVKNGLSSYAIEKKYGIKKHLIAYALRKYGLSRPRGGHNLVDLTGKRFGSLTVIKKVKNDNSTGAKWLCRCECGQTKAVEGRSLINKLTKSCGCRLNSKMWKGYGELGSSYWSRVMRGAKRRKLAFEITMEYAWNKYLEQNKQCALTGLPIKIVSNYYSHTSNHTASLDRIDSSKGYVPGNVQWVHKSVNIMKSNMTEDHFIDLCQAVVDHRKQSLGTKRLSLACQENEEE